MRMDHESSLTPRWIVFGTALVYFALGSVLTAQFMHLKEVWADGHRVFQLEIHHAVPGKVPALEERFRRASRLQARHVLEVVGYWAPEAKTHWDALHADPAFKEYLPSEKADQLIQGVDSPFMRSTDYSATK
jgi:hypothetical protein